MVLQMHNCSDCHIEVDWWSTLSWDWQCIGVISKQKAHQWWPPYHNNAATMGVQHGYNVDSNDTIHNVGNPSINNHCQPYLTASNRYGGWIYSIGPLLQPPHYPTFPDLYFPGLSCACVAWVPDVSIFDSIVFIIPSVRDTILAPPGAQRQTLKK